MDKNFNQKQGQEKWCTPLIRVTPVSKYLAMVLFIALPFVGFWLGMEYSNTSSSAYLPENNSACTTEAKICPDGSSVGREGPNCEFAECPDRFCYSEEKCALIEHDCPDGWQFYSEETEGCGCGCREGVTHAPESKVAIPDHMQTCTKDNDCVVTLGGCECCEVAGINKAHEDDYYTSYLLPECGQLDLCDCYNPTEAQCVRGKCVAISVKTKDTPDTTSVPVLQEQEYKCTEEQKKVDSCAQQYNPVCAKVQVQCITEPCPPLDETFSNACEACRHGQVDVYREGSCF